MKGRMFILILILLAAISYFFFSRFDVKSNRAEDGTYRVVMVDTKSGKIYSIMGN